MNMKPFPRVHCRAKVRSCEEIADGVYELIVGRKMIEPFLLPPSPFSSSRGNAGEKYLFKIPAPLPGQFFMLKAYGSGTLLGRPISVYHSDNASVRFLILQKGRGTTELCGLRKGAVVEMTGPSGNGFLLPDKLADALQEDASAAGGSYDGATYDRSKTEAFANASGLLASASALLKLLRMKELRFLRSALVGGGIGIAPISFFASRFPERCFDLFACFRSSPYGIEFAAPRAENVFVTTEDGSAGTKGTLPDVFKPADYDVVYACGPLPMLKYVKAACAGKPTVAFLSLEQHMACGAGACLGCSIPTVTGNKRCCVDGPVFNAAEVCW